MGAPLAPMQVRVPPDAQEGDGAYDGDEDGNVEYEGSLHLNSALFDDTGRLILERNVPPVAEAHRLMSLSASEEGQQTICRNLHTLQKKICASHTMEQGL